MLTRRLSLLLLVLLVGFAGPSLAQTTGSLVGRITDESGAPLPGVVVEAKSPALQGVRSAKTDRSGIYRLSLLPPGQYDLTFTLQGFAPLVKNGVPVSLAKDTTLDAALRLKVEEQVKVVGEVPTVDTTSTTLGTTLTSQTIQTLPTGRNYSSVVQVAPGISSDANPENKEQTDITVYGSSGAENSYYIDGVNTTGVEYGFQGKELNYEFIQEVDVKTGGYEAEYGRSTGGIVNVITKSGGNEFHGDVFGYYDNDSLQRNTEKVFSERGTPTGFTKDDFGADLGGYVVKDKLWFFGAYDRVTNTIKSALPSGPQKGEIVDSDSKRDLGAAKLTWRLSESQSLIATFFQDPRKDTGAINDANHTLNGEPLTYQGRQDFGGRDYALRYQGIFGSNWILSGQIARHQEQNSVGPVTSSGDIIEFLDKTDPSKGIFQEGGFGLIQEKTFKRDFFGGSLTRFLGGHEIKFGAEYEDEKAEVIKRMSGGQQVTIEKNPNTASAEPLVYTHFYWTTPTATVNDAPVSALHASPEHKNTTLFLQDRWGILPNLTLNVGLRWDRQEIIDASGTRQIDLKHDYAPRIGFIWDPTKDHRTKVFGSFGRFYEEIPMDLVIRSFSFERQPRIINYSRTDTHPDASAESDLGPSSAILGGFTEPSDPHIRGQYIREIILGGEREVLPEVALGIKGIYRDYQNVIEDFLCINDGTYCIGNPGRGIMKEVFALDYMTKFPAPRPVRIYRGVQIDATKRLSHNWQGIASYVYSKIEGNYDGEYGPFTNVGADPNISAAYDYYDFFTNGRDLSRTTNRGDLSNDRRHQFKASGIWFSPWKLSVGLSAYYRTGTPLTRYGFSDAYSRYEFFLTRRGAEGRTPSNYEADLHLGYPLPAGRANLNFLLDIFNILDAQRPILLDERWGFVEADNSSPTPVNPNYKKPILRTSPTSFRLGLRVSF